MAVTLVDSLGSAQSTSTTSIVVTIDWTTTAGNLLIAFVGHNNANAVSMTGWTQLAQASSTTNNRCVLFGKIAAGGDSSPTATWTTNSKATAWVGELSGTDTGIIAGGLSAEQFTTNGSSANGTSLTVGPTGTLTANGLAFSAVEWFDRETSVTFTAGWADAGTIATTTTGASTITIASKTAASGTTESCQHSLVPNSTNRHGITVIFYETGGGTNQALSGSVAAAFTSSGALALSAALQGTSQATVALSGSLGTNAALAGSAAVSVALGAPSLKVAYSLTGSVALLTSLTGSLSLTSAMPVLAPQRATARVSSRSSSRIQSRGSHRNHSRGGAR